jgi:peptide deformylase
MTLAPLDQNDPRLRQVCAALTRANLRNLEQQLEVDALIDFMYGIVGKPLAGAAVAKSQPKTVGLSANQVGIMKQICAVDMSIGRRGYTDIYILVNPKVVWASKSVAERPEGCVNFATTWGITRRSRSVCVQALDRSGNELELKLTGWPATLIQHEIDHLNGRLFIDRLPDPSKAHRVEGDEYVAYRKSKPGEWQKLVDVSSQAITLPELYQSHS